MTDGDHECRRCGLSGSARWLATHGHRWWSSWLLPWLGDFSGLLSPWQLDGRRLWPEAGGKHRKQGAPGPPPPPEVVYEAITYIEGESERHRRGRVNPPRQADPAGRDGREGWLPPRAGPESP